MILPIKSNEEAEAVLRQLSKIQENTYNKFQGCLIFDIDPAIDGFAVPFVLRQCKRPDCSKGEYCGPDSWSYGFGGGKSHCPVCQSFMQDSFSATLAIQGDTVIQTNYRNNAAINLRSPSKD